MGLLSAVFVFSMLTVSLCSISYDLQGRNSSSETTTEDQKKHLLDRVPLIVGNNWLPQNLGNQLKGFNFENCGDCKTDLLKLRKGKVGAQFWTVYVYCSAQYKDVLGRAMEQIDVIKRLIEKYSKDLQFVNSTTGIEEAFRAGKIGSLIGVQGGHSIDSRLAVLRMYYDAGVRYLTIAAECNTPWSTSSGDAAGLNNFGRKVVIEMNRLGMMVDLSFASHETRMQAITTSQAPVIFSGSNAKELCNDRDNVGNDILEKLKEKGGLVMVYFQSTTLKCDGTRATLDDVVDHINHIRNVAGVDHVGIGGGYGYVTIPAGLEDSSHFPDLFDKLKTAPGPPWTEEDLEKLAGLNLLRVFKDVEKVRDNMAYQEISEELLPEDTIPKDARDCRTN